MSCLMPDRLSPARRSWNMSRIKGMNTTPERAVRRCAYTRGLRYRIHVMSLPGRPDLVFFGERLAVFIDGDFWHGWRYPQWSQRLGPYWQAKIERNRRRDIKNFRKLRAAGWTVLRLWEHDVMLNVEACVDRIEDALAQARGRSVEAVGSPTARLKYFVAPGKTRRSLHKGAPATLR
jgi:DNA mismatch endonuclease (patch repair protein)